MSIRLLSVIIVSVLTVGLGGITLLNNYRRSTHLTFFMLTFFTALYDVVNFLADKDQSHALLWVRTTFALAALLLYFIVAFANGFPSRILSKGFQTGVLLISLLVSWMSFWPWLVPSVDISSGVSSVVPGPLYPAFILYVLSYIVLAAALILYALRHSSGLDRARVRYLFAGLIVTAVTISITNLFLPLEVGNDDSSAYGTLATLIFIAASTVAIVRHRLFDIRLVVARSVAYVLLLATFSLLYGAGLFVASTFLFPAQRVGGWELTYYAATALLLALTFQPMRRFFERVTDSVFFRDRYDSEQVLNTITKILATEILLKPLLDESLRALCAELHAAWGEIFVFSDEKIYTVGHYGRLPEKLLTMRELKELNHSVLVADELAAGRRKEILDKNRARITVSLRIRGKTTGVLVLGDKLSGDIYSSQDIGLLEILSSELAVAIDNARAYQEIANFNATLQQKVEDATKRLRVANQNLRELDEAKDEFISMASHQLRTPLTSVKGYLSMVMEGDAGSLTETQREFLEYAYGGSQRMVNLVSDLLNVSRMSSGKFFIEKAPINLAEVVADEVQQLQQHAQAKQLKLTFVAPKQKLPPLVLDENKTRQVIMNFIDNAIYYTKEGGVTVSLEQADDRVELRVRDSGIGVPKSAQKQLFTKFFRAPNAQATRPDGTGLGLFLAKRVVEDQGGTIIFESSEGKGSTFGFAMPLTAEETSGSDQRPPRKRVHAAATK